MLINHSHHWQFIFFQEKFHKNSQTIHFYCFSQYQQCLCKMFLLWIYTIIKVHSPFQTLRNRLSSVLQFYNSLWLFTVIKSIKGSLFCYTRDNYVNSIWVSFVTANNEKLERGCCTPDYHYREGIVFVILGRLVQSMGDAKFLREFDLWHSVYCHLSPTTDAEIMRYW